jgi:glutamyl-tRNA(Gln) amidotransferase subunit E
MSSDHDGLLVGIEVHQQLASQTKLFCACPTRKSDELPYKFERRLRPSQSELGKLDPAAVYEYSRGRANLYRWSTESACLVDADEEPPHRLNPDSLEAALLVSSMLKANIVDEIHVMRKIVIDGSNTAGFQRTAVVGLGGWLEAGGRKVGVQSVTVEEDAARILGEDQTSRSFALDRLGVPLVEIALDPVSGSPEFVGQLALALGRTLRSTGRVARGLGTIRQDLNVSLKGGKVVEVKGVQKLNLVPKVIQYEARRQGCLMQVSDKLKARGVSEVECSQRDVTHIFQGTGCRAIANQVKEGGKVACVRARNLSGLFGWEPYPGVRLGKEVAEVARANGLGGVIHSDEFKKQGISDSEADSLRKLMPADDSDGLVLISGPAKVVETALLAIEARLKTVPAGVPAETRSATEDGETRYMRPRPGSQRMYPETDIPLIPIGKERLSRLRKKIPEGWEAVVDRMKKRYRLSEELALKVYDDGSTQDFERLCEKLDLEPSVVASTLVDLPARLAREGVGEGKVTVDILADALVVVDEGLAAKEALPQLVKTAVEERVGVREAASRLGLRTTDEKSVREAVEAIADREKSMIEERGMDAFSPLMGALMKELRGKADGALVGRVLKEAISRRIGKEES